MQESPSPFSHLDAQHRPSMVDVGAKAVTRRSATARALISMPPDVLQQLEGQGMNTPKGPIFQTAVLAGIMAAKKTGDLIPLCHPLGLEDCQIRIGINGQQQIEIWCQAVLTGKTGVEMEALTGVSIAALTIYDMCKALSHDIIIQEICLMEKTGGKRDFRR